MKFKRINPSFNYFLSAGIAFCFFLLSSCGSDNSSGGSLSGTGALDFNVVFHGAASKSKLQATVIDCAGEGVVIVKAEVFDSDNELLKSGGPWNCDAGQGTISSVPAGDGRTIVILGKDSDGDIVFRGAKSAIQVNAGRKNDAGTIDCYAFVPSLLVPAGGSTVNADAMGLAWSPVAGAIEYRVIVSENSDLTDPFIDELSTIENYAPRDLSDAHIYYWQVIASDSYETTGIASQILSFSVDAQHINSLPVAQIVSPTDGSTYTTNDSIMFIGNGSDNDDGNLSGTYLAWRSDLNGPINTGDTFTSDALSAGTHEITLTAIDSEGATVMDGVVITVNDSPSNTSPVAQITSPAHGSTFTDNDEIVFEGNAIDIEDGRLSTASLVWRSDVDGWIGLDETFALNTLSPGTHRITLTATDSEDATGMDTAVIEVDAAKLVKVLFAIDCSGSMGAAGAGSDPTNQRLAATLAFVEQYNINPDVYFEIMLWNSEIKETTMVDGYRGFTKDMGEIQRVLDSVENTDITDYVSAIEGIYLDIRRDILGVDNQDNLASTEYVVIFFSDGFDDVPWHDGPRVTDILGRVDDLYKMSIEDYGVGNFHFHTFMLPVNNMTPDDRKALIELLKDMAGHGNGQFHLFDTADIIDFITAVDISGR